MLFQEAVWQTFCGLRLRGSRAKWLLHSPGSLRYKTHLGTILQRRPLCLGFASIYQTASKRLIVMHTTKTCAQHISTDYLSVILACVLLLGVVGACDDGTTPPLANSDSIVYGDVKTTSGEAVQDVRITVTGYLEEQCPNDEPAAQFIESSDTEGRFEDELGSFTPDTLRCLTIEAEALTGSNLADTTFTVKPVDLELREDPPFDSLRVDVVLPPAPTGEE